MGIIDKVKQQASPLADRIQEQAKAAQGKAQEKFDELADRRRSDQLLHDLGVAYFADRQGRGSTANSAEIERLVSELAGLPADPSR